MIDKATLKSNCESVTRANKMPPLSEDQYALLFDGESPERLAALDRACLAATSGNPEAVAMVANHFSGARLADRMISYRIEGASKRVAMEVLKTQGAEKVRNLVLGIMDGNEGYKRDLQVWVNQANAALGIQAPAPQAQAPRPRPNLGAVPPPPGVVAQQVRMDPAANNVHQLRPAPQPTPQPAEDCWDGEDPFADAPVRPAPQAVVRHMGGGEQPRRTYDQHNCYGRDVAVQFQNIPAKPNRDGSPAGFNTVMIKMAKAKGNTCLNGVDWDGAILLNLEPHEVQLMVAVFMGYGSEVRCAGHGRANEKWLTLEATTGDWEGAFRLQLVEGQRKLAVNIGPTDIGDVTALFWRALMTQQRADSSFVLFNIRNVYAKYAAAKAAKDRRQGGGRPQGGRQHNGNGQYAAAG